MEVLQYNTDRTQLIIPEYGRHVQIMVNQLMVTQDREERNPVSYTHLTLPTTPYV